MYPRKEFDECEHDYSILLRRKLEEAEEMIRELNPGRERSLALTKLDEALLWANVSISSGGLKKAKIGAVQNAGTVGYELDKMKNGDDDRASFEQLVCGIQRGIEANAPKREDIDLCFDIQLIVSKAIRNGIDQTINEFIQQGRKEASK